MAERKRRRVALLSTQLLLGEALANILQGHDDVELIGPLSPSPENILRMSDQVPDIFLLVKQGDEELDQAVAAQILTHFPDHPLLQVSPEQSQIRVITSESHSTSSADLLETIRSLPFRSLGQDRTIADPDDRTIEA